MIQPVATVAAMAPYALADLGPPGAVSLAQNESAFGPSPRAIAAGRAALADGQLYPDPDWHELRAAIAQVHHIDAESILCGAGSMELIGALIRAFAGPGDEVLGSAYGYLFLATATQQAGATHIKAPEVDLTVSVDALLSCVTDRTRILFLCNPGNPTGTRIPNAEILRLRAALPASVLLVVDQAYGEFDDQDASAILRLPEGGDTVVLRTFSKAYALAGARAGWGLFPQQIAVHVRKLMNPNNISRASQDMATAAMLDQAHMRKLVADTASIRASFVKRLRGAGLSLTDSHTNFVLIRFADAKAAAAANAALGAGGIILRGMGGYGLANCLRATIGPANTMAEAADILIDHAEVSHAQ